jgi:hypothetical protein
MSSYTERLRPGSVHVYEPRGAVVLGVGIWAKKDSSGRIHIHIAGGERFHTTVMNNPDSKMRYHRTLFRNLRRTLIANGAWPFGEEGSETEEGPEEEND